MSGPITIPLVGPRSLRLRAVRDGGRVLAYLESLDAQEPTGAAVVLPLGLVPTLRSALSQLMRDAAEMTGCCPACSTPLAPRTCEWCGGKLSITKKASAKFCSDRCRNNAASARARARRREERE